MMITGRIPAYLNNCKLALFSKANSTIIENIDQIRPIGVLPVTYKVIEKTIQKMTENTRVFETGIEQAGFTKNRQCHD